MRGILAPILAAAMLGAGVEPLGAHHSIARFDGQRVVRITGVVTEFRWINPHASIGIDSTAEQGAAAVHWIVEMAAPGALMGDGWQRQSLVAGDRVTIFANPLREEAPTDAPRRALYLGIVLPGGRTLGQVGEQVHTGDQ